MDPVAPITESTKSSSFTTIAIVNPPANRMVVSPICLAFGQNSGPFEPKRALSRESLAGCSWSGYENDTISVVQHRAIAIGIASVGSEIVNKN